MIDLWTRLATAEKPIFLYGTGDGADKILDRLEKRNIKITGVFASDGFVRNRTFRGFRVMSFGEVLSTYGDIIALLCFGTQLPDVIESIKEIAEKCELYAPDVPVIDDGTTFDISYVIEHKNEIKTAYEMLADEVSKKVFQDVIMFKLTGEIKYLFDCESTKEDAYDILGLSNNEHYLDLGAYTGDTINEFLEHTNGYNSITAVEPDAKNFKKLTLNTENLENITLINAAVAEENGETVFSMKGGRNSKIDKEGKIIKKVCVDGISTSPPTYIKMDIEGMEEKGLFGAKDTLKNKPKLNIAAYHRNQDIFSIPRLIKELNGDYKIYLRHHPYLPAWDTNFYVL